MSRLSLAREQIVVTRRYTARLLDQIEPAEWFRQPAGGVTHIAWQVGHLAMAEYRLGLERIRGRSAADETLISDEFLARFARESVPDPDPARNPSPAEIRAVFDRVHERVLQELQDLPDAELDRPPLKPHPLFNTKLESLFWCAHHEMLHAGQIGLLRRLFGKPYVW